MVLSDYTSSWNDLGASFYAVYQNSRLHTAIGPVLLISAYFALITGLQTVTPLLFTSMSFNHISTQFVPEIVGFLNFNATQLANTSYLSSLLSNTSDWSINFDWYMPTRALSLLRGNISVDTPSVFRNVGYDTLQYTLPAQKGSVTVNRTEFRVSCGRLLQDPVITAIAPKSTISPLIVVNFLSADDSELPFTMTDTLEIYHAVSGQLRVLPFGSKPYVLHEVNILY
jgi:hypothetical protein